jgi:hypothetical protein
LSYFHFNQPLGSAEGEDMEQVVKIICMVTLFVPVAFCFFGLFYMVARSMNADD